MSYFSLESTSTDNIQHVRKSVIPYKDVSVGLMKDSALMGNFPIPPFNVAWKLANINMISSSTIPFDDTWTMPSELELDSFSDKMPLSPFELAYVAIQ